MRVIIALTHHRACDYGYSDVSAVRHYHQVFPTVPLAVHGVIAILTSALFTVVLLVWLESRDMEHHVTNRCAATNQRS